MADMFDDLSLVDDLLSGTKSSWTTLYWTKPVGIEEFTTSPDHMRNVSLAPRQLEALEGWLGKDPLQLFDKHSQRKNLGVLCWGKGSGKNMVATVIQAYMLYVLLCMRNPLNYFGFPEGESVDMINVAASAAQAKRNFFDKFTRRILGWKWLKQNYDLVKAGRPLSEATNKSKGRISITEDSIEYSGGIKCISAHSDSKGYEGYSVVFFCMDEASSWETEYVAIEGGEEVAVSKAHTIFDTLRTSAISRSWKWAGLVISYPRLEDDFTLNLAQAILDKEMEGYADIAATWEVKPMHLWNDSTTFEHKIERPWGTKLIYPPKDFEQEFRLYPQQSELKYACIPSRTKAYFIYNNIKIHECAMDIPNIISLKKIEIVAPTPDHKKQTRYVGFDITNISEPNPNYDYYCHVDLSISKDAAVVGIAHGEPYTASVMLMTDDGDVKHEQVTMKVVVDQLIGWDPDNVHLVSHLNVDEVLKRLDEKFRFRYLSFDQFNSSYTLEKATRQGRKAGQHNVNNKDYFLLRSLIFANAIEYPKFPVLLTELEKLIWNGKRVDHGPNGCFTGDTRVALLDGSNPTFEELSSRYGPDEDFWVYSMGPNGIQPGRARNSRVTKSTDELVEVTLDSNQVIRCTPDHLFMTVHGEWVRAENLTPDVSIMPLYRTRDYKGGWASYENVWCPARRKRLLTHQMVAKYFHDVGHEDHVHHEDENKGNNSPENLSVVDRATHLRHHTTKRHQEDPEYVAKLRAGHAAYRENGGNERSRQNMVYLHQQGILGTPKHGCAIEECGKVAEAKGLCGAHYQKMRRVKLKALRHSSQENHRVISVARIALPAPVDVWDITVEETHNFALSSGVFVHNSKDYSDVVAGLARNILSGEGEKRQKVRFSFG